MNRVSTQSTQKTSDPLSGYFSSVMLALLMSHTLASFAVDFAATRFYLPSIDLWRYNIASGLFLGLVLADPVGAVITRIALRNVVIKFALGFALGVIIQMTLVTPFAGGGLSRFVFLFIATLLVPVIYSLNRLHAFLAERGTDLSSEIAYYALRVMNLPDRGLIILIMTASFAGFWLFSPDPETTILCILAVLAMTTVYVICVHVEEEDPWEGLLPEDEEDVPITQIAAERLAYLTATIVPGAFLFGATMHVALLVLQTLFPDVGAKLMGPLATVQTVGAVAATALGIVFFGMLSALGFGLAFVLLVGRIGNWSQSAVRDRCLRLIKVLCFRPIDRAA